MARGEFATTTRFIKIAYRILEEQHTMIIRQLFYAMVGLSDHEKAAIGGFQNCQQDYKRVSRMMTKARKEDRVPWEWIVDRSRPAYEPNVWNDLEGYKSAIKRGYRKDYWSMQPTYLEIWCEKDGVAGSIQDLTDELGIVVRTSRGFQSTTKVRDIAQVFAHIGKPILVLFLGDHDPSGQDIERDIKARVDSSLTAAGGDYVSYEVQRIAIFKKDIKDFKLPPQLVKADDSRADKFIKRHGNKCVELDALPPAELRRRIRNAVEAVLDVEKWNRAVNTEKAEMESIERIVNKWKVKI